MSSNNALLEFVLHSAPGVQEHLLDSKKDVDRRLKLVCEQFISDTSHGMLGPITAFNTKVTITTTITIIITITKLRLPPSTHSGGRRRPS